MTMRVEAPAGEGPQAPERDRLERELAQSEAELGASLRVLEARVRSTLSPTRIVEAHVGWLLVGAFAVGFGIGWRR